MKKFKIIDKYFSGYIKARCKSCNYQFGIHKNKKSERYILCPFCGKFEKKDWSILAYAMSKEETIAVLAKTSKRNKRRKNYEY